MGLLFSSYFGLDHVFSELYIPFYLFAELMNYEFDRKDILCHAVCAVIGVWYLLKKVRVVYKK